METRTNAESESRLPRVRPRSLIIPRGSVAQILFRAQRFATAEWLWLTSCKLYQAGHPRAARSVKAANFYLHHGLLPVEAVVHESIRLGHHGLGVVIHPNTTIGSGVHIWHSVTIAAETKPGSPWHVHVGDRVTIGAGAIIVARGDRDLVIGADAVIGAGAVVTSDVPPAAVMVGSPARPLPDRT